MNECLIFGLEIRICTTFDNYSKSFHQESDFGVTLSKLLFKLKPVISGIIGRSDDDLYNTLPIKCCVWEVLLPAEVFALRVQHEQG